MRQHYATSPAGLHQEGSTARGPLTSSCLLPARSANSKDSGLLCLSQASIFRESS